MRFAKTRRLHRLNSLGLKILLAYVVGTVLSIALLVVDFGVDAIRALGFSPFCFFLWIVFCLYAEGSQ